ncbi:Putative FKBP-type peptidyl-prolyl cis-trans isomerase [uncultured archaeon]|nr:Putative FKBP-type peptidyl-prolyl cis-trans isomerase [uncultured archaeon]
MPIKKHDFVELEYTGRLKEGSFVFDTTDEKTAKEAQIFTEKSQYAPIVICIGEHMILRAIDEFLEGKELGNYALELPAEKAFGKKTAELVKMIPTSKFTEQEIKPVPGLRLNIDNYVGIVKTVSGGRTVVDFNHPLAGRDVVYELKLLKIVNDKKVQVESLLRGLLGVKAPVEVKENKVAITFPAELPEKLKTELAKKLAELTSLEVSFEVKKEK